MHFYQNSFQVMSNTTYKFSRLQINQKALSFLKKYEKLISLKVRGLFRILDLNNGHVKEKYVYQVRNLTFNFCDLNTSFSTNLMYLRTSVKIK
jgi:hypothetical protein